MRVKLIVNPRAGLCRGKITLPLLLSKIDKKLKGNGCEVDIFVTKKKGDALMEARTSINYEVIVVAGGDGTINEVVNGIGLSGVPLGLIPLGTVNLFAKELGIPENPLKACDVILKGNVREIDLGKASPLRVPRAIGSEGAQSRRAGDHYFTLMAGVGFDAEIVDTVMPEMKKLLGPTSYPLAGIKTLAEYKATLMSIEIDDRIREAGYLVIISNAKRYASEIIRVAPHADITDGLLDIHIFKNGSKSDLLRYTVGVLSQKHTNYSDVKSFRAKKVRIIAQRQVLVHTDCEIIPTVPHINLCAGFGMEFSVLPKALKIITP